MFIVIRVLESVVMVNLENPPVSGLRSQEGKKKGLDNSHIYCYKGYFREKENSTKVSDAI